MRHCLNSFVIVLVALFLSNCDRISLDKQSLVSSMQPTIKAFTDNDNSISLSDIEYQISKQFPVTKGQSLSMDITPYTSAEGTDTLLYIVNYPNNKGWKIYSADARTPAIIAEGHSGTFSLNSFNGAVAAWMNGVAKDMERVRNARDIELAFTPEQIAAHKAFWGKESNLRDDPEGHWEETIYPQEEIVDTCDHMVPHWDQWSPYNLYCPYTDSADTLRSPAGCVAIAGSQMLYYLHSQYGIPALMVSDAYCYGDVINGYTSSFYNSTTTVWNNMNYEYHDSGFVAESVMIGHIGNLVEMHYSNVLWGTFIFSWALPENLIDMFDTYGYSCYGDEYDESVVASSLPNGMPVIIAASEWLIPVNGIIHAFVIDAYKRTRTKYTHIHHWVAPALPPDPGSGSIIVEPDDYITYSYSSPQVTAIKINWGWWDQWDEDDPQNDGWYTLTGSWTVYPGIQNKEHDYDQNRWMIYGFSVNQN